MELVEIVNTYSYLSGVSTFAGHVIVIGNDGEEHNIPFSITAAVGDYIFVKDDYTIVKSGAPTGSTLIGHPIAYVVATNSAFSDSFVNPRLMINCKAVKSSDGSGDSEFSKPPHHCTPDPRFDGKMNNYRYPGVPPKGREGKE